MITVRAWGVASSVVDAGRCGQLWLGKSRGGAVDVDALALANRLVGNSESAPAFETSGGLTVAIEAQVAIAVAGGVADIEVEGGPPVGWGSVAVLPAGCVLRVGRLRAGARVYVAVRGGLRGGAERDRLQLGRAVVADPATAAVPRRPVATTVTVWPGPRLAWFGPDAWRLLCSQRFVVSDTSRVGARLEGTALVAVNREQLPSEGIVEGAIQVPPDGQPIVMLADHPTTGGYPVIAVVSPSDVGHVAQAAVGSELRFNAHR